LNKQPLFILVTCFILGIFFQDYVSLDKRFIVIVTILCSVLLLALFLRSYLSHRVRPIFLALMFFFLGIILHSLNTFPLNSDVMKFRDLVTFKIVRKLNSTEKYKKYEVIAQAEGKNIKSILYIPKNVYQLNFDYYYKGWVFIQELKPPVYDFQFNYSGYLNRKNIRYQMYLSGELLSVARNDMSLKESIQQRRLEVLQKIDGINISPKNREFLKGIILADRTEMDSSVIQDFSKSGLVHFLAISGTHIMVVFGVFYFIFRMILPLKSRKCTVILSLIFIWMFALFIGFGNSVLRACIMLTVYFIYVLLQRKPDVLHSVALSAFIILFMDSQQLFTIGFQLSFIAVIGIFWLNQPLLKCFPKQDNYFKKVLFNTISVSVSAQLATIPLVLYYFHQFSFISIVANFIVIPFSELIIICSFVIAALAAFNIDFNLINQGYDIMINGLLTSIRWFADFDSLFFENIPMNLVEVFILSVSVYWLRFVILKFNFENRMILICFILLFFIARAIFTIVENQKDEVVIYDSGKNKVLSIKYGNKALFWISDSSDRGEIIKYIINPYCTSRRIKSAELKSLDVTRKKIIYRGKIYEIK